MTINYKILVLFYCSITESILHNGIAARFGYLFVQLRSQLSRIIRTAMKTTGSTSSYSITHALITYYVSMNMNGLMVYVHVAVIPVLGDAVSQIQLSVTLLNEHE